MKISRTRAALLLTLFTPLSALAWDVPSGNYGLDKTHGYITFTYSHLGFSNPHVGFDAFEVSLVADSERPENSLVEVAINAASINSRVDVFDEHLNGEDFFDTANNPTITFISTSVEPSGENRFSVTGDLTIKGVTKPVTLATTINKAGQHPMRGVPTIGVTATGELLRSEWELGAYAPAVSDRVGLLIDVELRLRQDEGM